MSDSGIEAIKCRPGKLLTTLRGWTVDTINQIIRSEAVPQLCGVTDGRYCSVWSPYANASTPSIIVNRTRDAHLDFGRSGASCLVGGRIGTNKPSNLSVVSAVAGKRVYLNRC